MNEIQLETILLRMKKIEKEMVETGKTLDRLLLEKKQSLFKKILNNFQKQLKMKKPYKESINKIEKTNATRINLAEVLGFMPMAAQVMYPGDYPKQNKVKDK